MKTSELFAKLEAGYVLERYQREYPYKEDSPLDKKRFMGFYRVPAGVYEGGHPYKAYHCRFGWASALGTIEQNLLSIVQEPEMWGCRDKRVEEYKSEFEA
jgi:hypothetical protein